MEVIAELPLTPPTVRRTMVRVLADEFFRVETNLGTVYWWHVLPYSKTYIRLRPNESEKWIEEQFQNYERSNRTTKRSKLHHWLSRLGHRAPNSIGDMQGGAGHSRRQTLPGTRGASSSIEN